MGTKIDWCMDVWNPVWGCRHGCEYCYARTFARRFYSAVARKNGLSPEETEKLRNFEPVFLPHALEKKFSGKVIFVNSMSDVAFWKKEWVDAVFDRIRRERDKYFLFLTKAPVTYHRLFPKDIPDNVYIGISVSDKVSLVKRSKELFGIYDTPPHENVFVSIEPIFEPLLGECTVDYLAKFSWVIVGPQTLGVKADVKERYKRELKKWVKELDEFCQSEGIPLFTKAACAEYGVPLVRKFPF